MRPAPSDARLARRASDGDELAFAAIFRRYHQELYRFCLSILARPEDAQEALQNTMVKALRSLPGERREIHLKPWLYRVAHNESIDLLRRRREGPDIEDVQASAVAEIAETVELRARLSRLLADLAELPARQRSALVMRELAGLGYEQIGEAFETSAAAARQTVYEARLGLRELEAGRELSCEKVTRQLSEADGRTLRRRDIRAHLRVCADCRAFRDAIPKRREDLAALAPLPAVAAAAILHGVSGGSAAAGGGLGGGTGAAVGAGASKAAATSLALKATATVVVATTIGVTAADRSGMVDLGLPGDNGSSSSGVGRAMGDPASGGGGVRAAAASTQGAGAHVTHVAPTRHPRASRGTLEFNPAPVDSSPSSPHPDQAAPTTLPATPSQGQKTAAAHQAQGKDNPGQAHRHEPSARGLEARNGSRSHEPPAKGKAGEPGKGRGRGKAKPEPPGKGKERNGQGPTGKTGGKGKPDAEPSAEDPATTSPNLAGESSEAASGGGAGKPGHEKAPSP
jgi:RNA polymerase sigma factor (sigma-70 family)